MNDQTSVLHRLSVLERRLRRQRALTLLCAGALLTMALNPQRDVLRVRGLVVEDAGGRERIVLGAPMRNASDDPKLAETIGLAVLDSLGRLHVAVGTDRPLVLADGRLGERIGSSTGLTFYDPRDGRERGGIGAFSDGRANVCLDYEVRQKEAVCLSVAPGDQYAAVILNGTPNERVFDRAVMYVGADGSGSIKVFGGGANQGGVMIRTGAGPATITVYDSTGAAVGQLSPRD